jgi:hypothetical protein
MLFRHLNWQSLIQSTTTSRETMEELLCTKRVYRPTGSCKIDSLKEFLDGGSSFNIKDDEGSGACVNEIANVVDCSLFI